MDEDFISFTAKVPTRIKEDDSPWSFLDQTRADKNGNPLVRLHNELLQFCNFVSLTSDELKERENVIKEVESIILKRFPTAKVQPFGSYISKLLTPMSDIDLVVLDIEDKTNNLQRIAAAIREENIASYLELIENAKVPIVKFDHAATGISIDILCNNTSGLTTGKIIKRYAREYPPLRPLTLFLKTFLTQRKLNDTYSGGIGSFVLTSMIVSFLQMRQNASSFYSPHATSFTSSFTSSSSNTSHMSNTVPTWNLGTLLIEFFNLYGNIFNYADVGISISKGGSYFQKSSRGKEFYNAARPNLLSIENPDKDNSVDMGRNSFNMPKIKRSFEHAYQVLLSVMQMQQQKSQYASILSYLIRSDDNLLTERLAVHTLAPAKAGTLSDVLYKQQQQQMMQQGGKKHGRGEDSDSDGGERGGRGGRGGNAEVIVLEEHEAGKRRHVSKRAKS